MFFFGTDVFEAALLKGGSSALEQNEKSGSDMKWHRLLFALCLLFVR